MRALVLMAVLLAGAGTVHAQPQPVGEPWTAPRTAFGAPDLQGVWTNASITKLTRSTRQPKLVVTPEEAKAIAKSDGMSNYTKADSAPTDPNKGAPAKGGDPGGYNAFWMDAGSQLAMVKGEYRTSWLVDPADGQLPFSPEGKALVARAVAFAHDADTPNNPESLQPWDRCIISSRGSGGPGMLNNIYNSNYQIVQTPTAVAISVEMVHDVRSIPLFPTKAAAQAGHGPAVMQPWLGDSTGWWEGDTLVIETVNVNREQGRAGPLFLTPAGKVTERLRRAGPGELYYEFTVEDRTYYSRPWRAEMTLTAGKDQLYEYACHEGNYAMPHILAGVREQEKRGKAPSVRQ